MQFVFIVCQVEGYQNALKLSCKPFAFNSCKAFLKSKKRSGTNLLVSFSAWILKKNISLYSITWLNWIFWLPLLSKILGNMCIAIVCYPGCEIINFEINLIFLIKLFFSTWPKSQHINLNIFRTRRASKIK